MNARKSTIVKLSENDGFQVTVGDGVIRHSHKKVETMSLTDHSFVSSAYYRYSIDDKWQLNLAVNNYEKCIIYLCHSKCLVLSD